MRALIHFAKFLCRLDEPASQVSTPELTAIVKYCAGAKVAVEIGCFEGRTTAAMAGCAPGDVYTIDPFFKGRLGICYGQWIASLYCRRLNRRNVRFLAGMSHEMLHLVPEPIDFIFIDGDHSDAGIRRDWNDWFHRVRIGGILALHDCLLAPNSPAVLGTTTFYETELTTHASIRQIETVGCMAVFRRIA